MDVAELPTTAQNIVLLHVYDSESKGFTSVTTFHGMDRLYNSNTWPSRIFWSLVVVTCLVMFMSQVMINNLIYIYIFKIK
jgi:hypothetical protein